MAEHTFQIEQSPPSFKIRVQPRGIDQLRLVVALVLCLLTASIPAAIAVRFASRIWQPLEKLTLLLFALVGFLVGIRMLLLAIGAGKVTVIEIRPEEMIVRSLQLITGKKLFSRIHLKPVKVKTVIGPVAVLEISRGYDTPTRVLLGHDITELRLIAEEVNKAIGHPNATTGGATPR